MTDLKTKPKTSNSASQKELDRAEEQFESFDQNIKSLTMDRMSTAPKEDIEPQTKLSQKQIERSKDIYLKPHRSIGCKEKFNENFRSAYEFDKEYVHMIAQNNEIIGEELDFWTKPYAGMPAEEWKVPVNTPVWAPRYVAEKIKRSFYHRLTMKKNVVTEAGSFGEMYGALAVDTTVQRLDAMPVSNRKSIFMGANSFS